MVKRREVEYHRRLPGSRQADSSGRLLALIVSRHAARARGPRRSPAPRRPASRCASARRLPSWACPTTAGKWGNKLPTARRDFCGDLGPDRVCVAPGRTQTAAGGAREEIYVGVDRRAASRRLCLRRPVQDNSLLFFPSFSLYLRSIRDGSRSRPCPGNLFSGKTADRVRRLADGGRLARSSCLRRRSDGHGRFSMMSLLLADND